MGMIALALPGHSTKTRAEQQADLDARRARARAALDVMARGEQPDGLKKLTEMSLSRVSGVADYDEPGILRGWESENKVVYTLEDEESRTRCAAVSTSTWPSCSRRRSTRSACPRG